MSTCPLCSEMFDTLAPYRDHLSGAHGLDDDEGAVTELDPRPADAPDTSALATDVDDALELLAAAMLAEEPRTAASNAPMDGAAPPTGGAGTPSNGRYELATRYGDVALYVPGAILLAVTVVRLEADVLGLAFLVLSTLFILGGMVLPVVHGEALDRTNRATDRTPRG